MTLLVIDNAHIYIDDLGNYYSPTIYDNDFFSRYTNNFEHVKFVCKVKKITKEETEGLNIIDLPNFEVCHLPWYRGMRGLLKNIFRLFRSTRRYMKQGDIYLFRVAQVESFIGYLVRKKRKPFMLEIVNDPKTYFKGLNRFFSNYMLKRMVKKADGISYITKQFIQSQYPPTKNKKTPLISEYLTIDIPDTWITKPRTYPDPMKTIRLIHVANNYESDSKGQTTVLKVAELLNKSGYDTYVTMVGDGTLMSHFKQLAIDLEIADKVNFTGLIKNKSILNQYYLEADLFIFPTQFEGLGRVNLEAQAAGLPGLSSPVGGVVELYHPKYLFDPLDFNAFTQKIMELMNNPQELEEMSAHNIENVKQYSETINHEKRNNFYQAMKLKGVISKKNVKLD